MPTISITTFISTLSTMCFTMLWIVSSILSMYWTCLCVAVWFERRLLDSFLERLGFLLSGCCAVGVRAARVHASGFQGPQRVAARSAAVGSQPSLSMT